MMQQEGGTNPAMKGFMEFLLSPNPSFNKWTGIRFVNHWKRMGSVFTFGVFLVYVDRIGKWAGITVCNFGIEVSWQNE